MSFLSSPRLRALFTKARFFVSQHNNLLSHLDALEYLDTCNFEDPKASLEKYSEVLKTLSPSDKVHVLLRELGFYEDGCTTWEPELEPYWKAAAVVKRQVIALYLREAIEGMNKAGVPPAEQLKMEKAMCGYSHQAWFFKYPDEPGFVENFKRDATHGHLVLVN